ncbi:hypothetical protein HPB50_026185 [Hyalomma asiaticum]|uniref:Uncharacterized protein n=1 Tax=Hyalomma asiaticum TaxID=266040 RepID=A0ACB7RPB6_HYAAI|nr:hypothetical protein HPB50_026185 [Hyalomma asiaticum]
MPLPRREKTTYNDIREPATEEVPHIPRPPPSPVCIRQGHHAKYHCNKKWSDQALITRSREQGQSRTLSNLRTPPREFRDISKAPHLPFLFPKRPYYITAGISEATCDALPCRRFRGQGVSGSPYRGPLLSCYYRQYARDSGVCQSFVPLLHTMRLSEVLRAPQLSSVQQRTRTPPTVHRPRDQVKSNSQDESLPGPKEGKSTIRKSKSKADKEAKTKTDREAKESDVEESK